MRVALVYHQILPISAGKFPLLEVELPMCGGWYFFFSLINRIEFTASALLLMPILYT